MNSKACYLTVMAFLFANVSLADQLTSFDYEAAEIGGTGFVSGTFSYDTSIVDVNSDPQVGFYLQAGTWTGEIVGGDQNGETFSFDMLDIVVFDADDPPLDLFTMVIGESSLLLSDITGTAFDSDDLPTMLDLNSFISATLLLDSDDISGNQTAKGGGATIYAFTSITPTAVPEPGSTIVLVSALAFGLSRRKSICGTPRPT